MRRRAALEAGVYMDRARPYTSTGEDASSAPYGIGVIELQGRDGGLAAAGAAAKSRCTETMEKAGRRPGEDLSPESRSPLETAAPKRHPTPATAVGDERAQQGELRRLRTRREALAGHLLDGTAASSSSSSSSACMAPSLLCFTLEETAAASR